MVKFTRGKNSHETNLCTKVATLSTIDQQKRTRDERIYLGT